MNILHVGDSRSIAYPRYANIIRRDTLDDLVDSDIFKPYAEHTLQSTGRTITMGDTNTLDYRKLLEILKKDEDNSKENSNDDFLDSAPFGIPVDAWDGIFETEFKRERKKMKKELKIDKKVEDLVDELTGLEKDLEELIGANNHIDVSDKIERVEKLIDGVEELIEGYNTLINMNVGNVIISNERVITLTRIWEEKAISKPEAGDDFNFEMAFFMNLTKLGTWVNTDAYNYSVQKAIVDIKNGGLE